jgi:hypothetical protein
MNATEVAQRYLNAWNCHDADAIVAAFAEGGTLLRPGFDHAVEPVGGLAGEGRRHRFRGHPVVVTLRD